MAPVLVQAPKNATKQPSQANASAVVTIDDEPPEHFDLPTLLGPKPTSANSPGISNGKPPDWLTSGRHRARFNALVTALVAEHERVIQHQEFEKRELWEQLQAYRHGEESGPRVQSDAKSEPDPEVHQGGSNAMMAGGLRRAGSEPSGVVTEDSPRLFELCGEPVVNVKSGKSAPSSYGAKSHETSDGRKRILALDCVQAFRQSSMAELQVRTVDWLTKLKRLLDTDQFEIGIMCVIVLSIVTTAVELQWLGSNTGYNLAYPSYDDGVRMVTDVPYDAWFRTIDSVVLAIFTVELVLRLVAHKLAYLTRAANWVDVIIVVTGLLDSCMQINTMSLQHLRLLRGLKLARIARGFRLFKMPRVFDCLRVIVEAIKASTDALLWSVGVLFVIHCVMALLMTQLVSHYLTDESIDVERRRDVFKYYGTFTRSLITMFEIMLANWSPPVRVIIENVGQLYGLPILFYRCVAGFAVLNVVNAVFIQQTIQVAQSDTEIMIMEKRRARIGYEKKLTAFFHKLDASGDGVLSFDEFRGIVDDPLLRSWLDALGIDPNHLREFFDLLDNGDGEITVDEFITGASRVRGQAQSIDMAYLVHHSRRVEGKIHDTYEVLRHFASELQVECPPVRMKSHHSGAVV